MRCIPFECHKQNFKLVYQRSGGCHGKFIRCVTGVSAGSATITATARDGSGKSASCDVSVSEVVVNQITAESQVNVSVGGTVQVYYALSPDNAANKSMIWEIYDSSVDPTDVASVDNNGRVTGLKAGHTRIYGYSVASPSIGALVHVYVNSFGISVSPSPLTLEDDGYAEMTITASGMTAEQLGQYQWYASCSGELELDQTVGTFSNSSGNGVGVFNVRKKSTAQSEDILNVNVIVKKISDSSVVAEKDITVYIE